MGRNGLLPLEPTECLLDSPYFREKLHAYEKELENASTSIKGLTKDIKEVLDAAKSKCIISSTTDPLFVILVIYCFGTFTPLFRAKLTIYSNFTCFICYTTARKPLGF